MTQWLEIIKIFGTNVTVAGIMGVWIYVLLQEKKNTKESSEKQINELQGRNDLLNDYIKESDKSNLQLLTEMRMLIATLTSNQDKLPAVVKDIISAELSLLKQTVDAIQSSINNRSQGRS